MTGGPSNVKIGPIQLRNNLIVAPMAGVTDRPFRILCKQLGAGMAVSEMVACKSLLWGSEKTIRRGNHEGEDDPSSDPRGREGAEGGADRGRGPGNDGRGGEIQRRQARGYHRHWYRKP